MTTIKRNFSVGGICEEGFISPKDPGIMCKNVRICLYMIYYKKCISDSVWWVLSHEIEEETAENCVWKLRHCIEYGKEVEQSRLHFQDGGWSSTGQPHTADDQVSRIEISPDNFCSAVWWTTCGRSRGTIWRWRCTRWCPPRRTRDWLSLFLMPSLSARFRLRKPAGMPLAIWPGHFFPPAEVFPISYLIFQMGCWSNCHIQGGCYLQLVAASKPRGSEAEEGFGQLCVLVRWLHSRHVRPWHRRPPQRQHHAEAEREALPHRLWPRDGQLQAKAFCGDERIEGAQPYAPPESVCPGHPQRRWGPVPEVQGAVRDRCKLPIYWPSTIHHPAYLILRNNGGLLISLLAMMLSTGMPELQAEADLEYMRTQLQLDQSITEEQALKFFRNEFNSSLRKGFTVTTNWWTHAIKQM